MKAIVVGAGIGGMATAVALGRVGIAVRVYEVAEGMRASGSALSLWPNARHALAALGLGPDAVPGAELDAGTGIFNARGRALSRTAPGVMAERYGLAPLVVERGALLRALGAEAEGVVSYGRRFSAYKQNVNAVTVHFEDKTFDTGTVLIGADGIYSGVRGQMHPRAGALYRGYAAWRGIADYPHAWADGAWGEYWGTGLRFGLLPLDGQRAYWFAVENRPADAPPEDHHAHLLATFGDWSQSVVRAIEATPSEAVLYNDVEEIDPLRTWNDGRVTLLGDAAHAMTPNLGQGACQAIEDAVVLAGALVSSETVKDGLAAYQAARLAHTKSVQSRAQDLGRAGQLANPVVVAARDAGMRMAPSALAMRALDPIVGNRVTLPEA